MVNRGKDSWNKAMLVDPQGNPSRPNKKMRSSTLEKKVRNEDEPMLEKNTRNKKTSESEKSIKNTNEAVPERNMRNSSASASEGSVRNSGVTTSERSVQNSSAMVSERGKKNSGVSTSERNMRNAGAMTARNKRATNGISNSKNTDSSNSGRQRKKTPLEAFDVKAFFEENLYDIIDLEENRSGVKEFEDAVKRDE